MAFEIYATLIFIQKHGGKTVKTGEISQQVSSYKISQWEEKTENGNTNKRTGNMKKCQQRFHMLYGPCQILIEFLLLIFQIDFLLNKLALFT